MRTLFGAACGFAGIGLLISPGQFAGGSLVDPVGATALIFATLTWAAGSLYSRRAPLPRAPLLATAMEMICGGVLLLATSGITGELMSLGKMHVSLRSALALGYLIVFGALVAFTAYVWLLRVTTTARVSTYAYVNPLVAVFLGWALAGEPITLRTMLAGCGHHCRRGDHHFAPDRGTGAGALRACVSWSDSDFNTASRASASSFA